MAQVQVARRSAVPAGLGSAHVARKRRRGRKAMLSWIASHAVAIAVAIMFVAAARVRLPDRGDER